MPENPQVHYESGASEQARTVARLLPAAMARVEAVQGRPFAHPVTVGVYITPEAFVAANGLGSRRAVQWFKEGLGVVVSGGGGAEGVSELQALEAIRHGDHIAIESFNSLFNLDAVKFVQPPEIPDTSFRILMAYRQAGLFVTFLRDTNPAGFARVMNAILDGRPFAEAVTTGYETDLQALWLHFVRTTPTLR